MSASLKMSAREGNYGFGNGGKRGSKAFKPLKMFDSGGNCSCGSKTFKALKTFDSGGNCSCGRGCKCESGTFKLLKMYGSGGNCRCDCGCDCDCRCEIFTDLPPPRGPPLEFLFPELHRLRLTSPERKWASPLTIEAASGIPALGNEVVRVESGPFMRFGPA